MDFAIGLICGLVFGFFIACWAMKTPNLNDDDMKIRVTKE